MDNWNTSNMKKDGQPFWLVRLSEKALNAIRDLGLPSKKVSGYLVLNVPTMWEQMSVMLNRQVRPILKSRPTGVLDFFE